MKILRVPGGGKYYFTDAEMMRTIKGKSLTAAKTMGKIGD